MADLDIADRCIVLQGDFFEYEFGRQAYDCALVGFFLSHLTEAQESLLFGALRHMLKSSGHFLILNILPGALSGRDSMRRWSVSNDD